MFLIFYGLLLAVSNADMAENVGNDPIGAMASILPTWYLIPYTIVAVLGLMSGSIMDNYSNGLALLSFGVKLPRTVAAALTAALTVLGVVYVTFSPTRSLARSRLSDHARCADGRMGRHVRGRCDHSQEGLQHR